MATSKQNGRLDFFFFCAAFYDGRVHPILVSEIGIGGLCLSNVLRILQMLIKLLRRRALQIRPKRLLKKM